MSEVLSSGLVASGCTTARCWSSVTTPATLTLTANTSASVVAVRPCTTPPTSDRSTFSPVAVSIRPESAPGAETSKAYVTVPAPSAPKRAVKLPEKSAVASSVRSLSSTVRSGTMPVVLIVGPSSSKNTCEPISAVWLPASESVKPPMSKLALKFGAVPTFSISTRSWVPAVEYSTSYPALTPLTMIESPLEVIVMLAVTSLPSASRTLTPSTFTDVWLFARMPSM